VDKMYVLSSWGQCVLICFCVSLVCGVLLGVILHACQDMSGTKT
jgi:hypothetical protein